MHLEGFPALNEDLEDIEACFMAHVTHIAALNPEQVQTPPNWKEFFRTNRRADGLSRFLSNLLRFLSPGVDPSKKLDPSKRHAISKIYSSDDKDVTIESISSPNLHYMAVLLESGQLVVMKDGVKLGKDRFGKPYTYPSTEFPTAAKGTYTLGLKPSGNLAVTDKSGKEMWSTKVNYAGLSGPFELTLNDEGTLTLGKGGKYRWSLPDAPSSVTSQADGGAVEFLRLRSPNDKYQLEIDKKTGEVLFTMDRTTVLYVFRSWWFPRFKLVLQGDGNLCLYSDTRHTWSTIISLQAPGNSDYPHTTSIDDNGIWAIKNKNDFQFWNFPVKVTGSYVPSSVSSPLNGNMKFVSLSNGPCSLALREGNLVLTRGEDMLWSSISEIVKSAAGTGVSKDDLMVYTTAAQGPYVLQLQSDGNLVIYKKNTINAVNSIWSSHTDRRQASAPHRLSLTSEGRIVLTDKDGNELWHRPEL